MELSLGGALAGRKHQLQPLLPPPYGGNDNICGPLICAKQCTKCFKQIAFTRTLMKITDGIPTVQMGKLGLPDTQQVAQGPTIWERDQDLSGFHLSPTRTLQPPGHPASPMWVFLLPSPFQIRSWFTAPWAAAGRRLWSWPT